MLNPFEIEFDRFGLEPIDVLPLITFLLSDLSCLILPVDVSWVIAFLKYGDGASGS